MQTRITEQYGIEHPFIAAALGSASMPPLVAAVSNAGGMGTLAPVGAPLTSPERLREQIADVRSLTSRPFGINFITPLASEEHITVCIEEQVPVVSFHWGEVPEGFIARLRESGVCAWMQVGSLEEARRAVAAGVDAVIVQGREAGGSNRSTAGVLTLIPAVVDAVSPVPVIGAGGIADGRGIVAALALGADAVWVGTRLLASQEANAAEEYKRRVIEATVADTAITTCFFGSERLRRPVRALRNRVVREWAGREEQIPPPADPPEQIGRTFFAGGEMPLYKFSTWVPTLETSGDFDEMCLLAGESAGLVRNILPAGQIVREMIAEAERIIGGRLCSVIGSSAAMWVNSL